MKIEEVAERFQVLNEVVERIKDVDGIEELYPPQEKALEKGIIKGKDSVLSVPTAAGKTLIAELAMLRGILEERGKALYIVPLKALANQKYQEFKEKYDPLGVKVAISTGDFDSKDPWLKKYDIIVASSEKADSLIRHGVEWLQDLSVVVADETHLIDSPDRGPTLEVTLTRLRELNPHLQFLLLSASLSNAKELAEWIGGELIESSFRPVKLYEGIYYDGKIMFHQKEEDTLKDGRRKPAITLAQDTLEKEKQAIVFVSTRRSAEAVARRLSKVTRRYLTEEEKRKLRDLSDEIYHVLSHPTEQCEKIAKYVKRGAAFHHAGLAGRQKLLLEDHFRNGLIKFIAATPSLAMGVDLPAFRVIIRDSKRWTGDGMDWIPTLDYQQMSGRAGRPKYDPYGEAILVAKSKSKIDELKERYIEGEAEAIDSKLAVEPTLRMYALTMICEGYGSVEKLIDFFSKTFYGHIYGSTQALSSQIRRVLNQLREFGFIEMKAQQLNANALGQRVSELYIDPFTAHKLINFLEEAAKKEFTVITALISICDTKEMEPLPSVRKREKERINVELRKREEALSKGPSKPGEVFGSRYNYYRFQKAFKMALVFEDWIKEIGEDAILDKYHVTPGTLFAKISIADWLLYASSELSNIIGLGRTGQQVDTLRFRVKHGVSEKLLELVQIRGIGRVRARKLFKEGIKSIKDLKEAKLAQVQNILGPKLGKKIKERAEKKSKR